MNLVVFDVDGTLTKSSKVDLASFSFLIAKTLGIQEMNPRLEDYEHATASYIYRYYFHQRHQRNPRPEELEKAQRQHASLLAQAVAAKPGCVKPIPGALRLLELLHRQSEWQVAIATGAWRASTLAKLNHAGLDVGWIPAAHAEDGLSREKIVGTARERAQAEARVVAFDRVVLVGDGYWDLRTARNLGYGFVGITCDSDPKVLHRHGARVILPDFSNHELFMRALAAKENQLSSAAPVKS